MREIQQKAGRITSTPARAIKPGYRGIRGHVVVLGTRVQHESNLERDFLHQMTLDRTLTAITEQPVTLPFDGPRGRTRYTPDYLTVHGGPSETKLLIECKERATLLAEWPTLKHAFREGRRFARDNGMRHLILTETEIRTPAIKAARFLKPFSRLPRNEGIEEHLVHRLAIIGLATPAKLLVAAYASEINRAEAVGYVWKLIGEWRIEADLDLPVTMEMPIWVDTEGGWRRTDPYAWRPIGLRVAAAQARLSGRPATWCRVKP